MHVIATAGHVDHGKSTLVRAVTGMEPDRLADERRRGLSIDLGYAWTTLDGGDTVAFVDVPGHERFFGTMLAGLGPAPAVMFVVAADEGWRQQSGEHLAAVAALGLRHGLLVVTRSDLADPGPAVEQSLAEIARAGVGGVPAVVVSPVTGAGMGDLRSALTRLVRRLPEPRRDGRIRLWVDRSFSIRGAGTVVTGTLGSGTLTGGGELQLTGRRLSVRGLECLGLAKQRVGAVARVAVNLRGIQPADVGRGDALLSPDDWPFTSVVDVRCRRRGDETPSGLPPAALPAGLVLHVGTAAVSVRVRPLGEDFVRLSLHRPLPLEPGDRLVLRDPGRQAVAAGAVVLDVDPPVLRRRGAAAARSAWLGQLAVAEPGAVLGEQVRRRGAVRRRDLTALGVAMTDLSQVQQVGDWLVDAGTWHRWQQDLTAAVDARASARPLDPRLSPDEAGRQTGFPDRQLILALSASAGLAYANGRIHRSNAPVWLGRAEAGLAELERQLAERPFAAPDKPELEGWGLGARELAAAERVGRLIRLAPDVVLLPSGPSGALEILASLPQPFTVSQARQALGTTRRVTIPLLKHLDDRGWTVRSDPSRRRVTSR